MAHAPALDAGIGDFFRHHGAWAPGIRLFRSLRFRGKAALISAVFLLPIGVLGWQYFGAQRDAIAFSAAERTGVSYQRAALPAFDALVALRSASMPGGDPAAARAALEAALAGLAQAQQGPGDALGLAKEHAALVDAVGRLPTAGTAPALAAALDLLRAANDRSNLTLDPDVDTYYLMDGALVALPRLLEATGRLQAVALDIAAGRPDLGRPLGAAETASTLADEQLAAAVAQVATVHAGTPERSGIAAARARLHRFHEQARAGAPAAGLHADGRATLDGFVAVRGALLGQLDDLLAARVARLERARNLTALALLASLGLAAYLFRAFQKVLEGGLAEVAHHIEAMRDGDLTTTPNAWGADEVAELMGTMTEMQVALRGIVQQVRSASDGIVTAASQIAAGSADLSARTEVSAASLQQSAAAMEQISTTTQQHADATREAAARAASNAQVAEQGGRIIGEVVQTMDGIRSASSRIAEIIGTIDGIAFQTNILALNAAVEAARAGESGRGFAVVAAEVRALAQSSAGAAREIKGLIGQSVEQVEAGSRVVRAAGSTMQDLLGNAGHVSALLTRMAAGIDEQAGGVAQTAALVQELDRATQQNAALVEESAAAAGSLESQAQGLAQRVARFRLGTPA